MKGADMKPVNTKAILKNVFSSAVILGMVVLMAEACSDNNPKPTANYKRYQHKTHKSQQAATEKKAVREEPAASVAELKTETKPAPVQEVTPTFPAVKSLRICSAVADREPVDDLTDVELDMGKIYTHTAISSEQADTIYHVYKFEGKEIARVGLYVGESPRWRTWSSKRLDPIWVGDWAVEIQSGTGDILAAKHFTVVHSPAGKEVDTIAVPGEVISSESF